MRASNQSAGGRHAAPRKKRTLTGSAAPRTAGQPAPQSGTPDAPAARRTHPVLQRLWWGLRLALAAAAVAPVLAFMVWFNYTVDCSGLYQGDLTYRNIVELLLSGENVSGFSQMDHRKVAELYIQLLPQEQAQETVALGSSRVMQITEELVGTSFFNYGVTGGDYRDLMNHFYLLDKYGKLPQRVIIGVDPWLLRSDAVEDRSNAVLYEETLARMLGHDTGYVAPEESTAYLLCDRLLQSLTAGRTTLTDLNVTGVTLDALFDPSYFQGNVDYWWKNRNAEAITSEITKDGELAVYQAVDASGLVHNTGEIKMADGSVWYSEEFRSSTADQVLSSAHAHAGNFLHMSDYAALETAQCILFEEFITYVQSCGVEVVFYLSPYHPFTYEYQTIYNVETHAGFFEIEPYLRAFAARQGITVVGSYDPRNLGLTEADFYDGLHVKTSGIAKFFGGFDADGNVLPGSQWDGVNLTAVE